ncbi:hypothetical protein I6N96_05110 [Enterococcus sp. BWM-S5]|uniref:Type II toxin-antitoxin system PemK/MazF family toxin n=1 Tax=Enterococcus larvae TaxID=2794352 RepID=A0ABS4CGA6_9ENTE|nr:hypothetical protein [Enterococcus larvae]MBP1045648.1 hypothetical protein [Enterococcus larvae]
MADYAVYFTWFEFEENNEEGKERPVVVIDYDEETFVYEIMGIYSEKSKYDYPPLTEKFYKIKDWESAGLKVPSYIDVSRSVEVSFNGLFQSPYRGQLSKRDVVGLLAKIAIYNINH